jgi:trehalose-6-phosphate synthase
MHIGLKTAPNGVEFQGKVVSVGAFPIGIDPDEFSEGLQKPKVQERIATLERKSQCVKLIAGVDRLQYMKRNPSKAKRPRRFPTRVVICRLTTHSLRFVGSGEPATFTDLATLNLKFHIFRDNHANNASYG